MIQVPLKLTKNGFTYTQVLRGRRSCLYEQHVTPRIKQFEVFIIRISPEREICGKLILERERFPGNEDFGFWAWSYWTMEEARAKFDELERNARAKDRIRATTEKLSHG